jgi:hypothetical protein
VTPSIQSKELTAALAKAEEYEKLASSAKTPEERDYYDRMQRKWLGIADGWKILGQFDKHRS